MIVKPDTTNIRISGQDKPDALKVFSVILQAPLPVMSPGR
jgi:hypothetical protein